LLVVVENKRNTGTGHNDRTGGWEQETRKTTFKMDGQRKRKHGIWLGKIKRDSKKQKQMAHAGGGKD
jgi:hypothetical protein